MRHPVQSGQGSFELKLLNYIDWDQHATISQLRT